MRALRGMTPLLVVSLLGCGPNQTATQKAAPSDVLPVTTSSPEARKLFEKARDAVYAHNEKVALVGLEEAVQKDPNFALAHLYIARAYANLDDRAKSDEALQKASTAAYDSKASVGEHYLIQAYYFEQKKETESQRAELLQLSRLYPADKYVLYEFGRYYDDFGVARYQEALDLYEKAIKTDPNFAPAYNNAAYLYAEQGDFTKATERIKRFAELSPDNPNAHDSAGELLLWAGKLDESIAEYSVALSQDPSFYFSYINQGHAYVFKGDYAKAREDYSKAKNAGRNDSEKLAADNWSAISFIYEKQPDAALKAMQDSLAAADALKTLPWGARMRLDSAWILLYNARLEEAKKMLADARTWRQTATLSDVDKSTLAREELFVEGLIALEQRDLSTAQNALATLTGFSASSRNPREQEYVNMLQASIFIAQNDLASASGIIQKTKTNNAYIFALQLREENAKHDPAGLEKITKEIKGWYRNSINYALVLISLSTQPTSGPASAPASAPASNPAP